jgi:membrane-associated phospholipid phosphatase
MPVRLKLIIIGTLTVLAVVFSVYAHWIPYFPVDLRLTLLFQSIHSNVLLLVMKDVSYIFASWRSAILVLISITIFWWCLGRFKATLIIAAGISSLLNSVFKIAVGRPRPTPDLVTVYVTETGKSFPSGHAFFAAVFLGLVAYLTFTHFSHRSFRILTSSSILILIFLIGASRIYLGAHWTSDVLGGYLLGAVFLIMFIWFNQIAEHHFQIAKEGPKKN